MGHKFSIKCSEHEIFAGVFLNNANDELELKFFIT
ncbi:MAG: hypothetical protein IGNPGNKH_00253 [Sodalis sp. Ffu]|nr:MAG: hypothetical protein IGNPGNKH_00253 [Sodalis sp. Ffu]